MRKLLAVLVVVALFPLGGVLLSSASAQSPDQTNWAVVRVDGTLARGHNTVSSAKLGADGTYIVTFNHDISGCSYVASGGDPGSFPPDDAITIGVGTMTGNNNAVAVIEYDAILARDSYSSGFHLIVAC